MAGPSMEKKEETGPRFRVTRARWAPPCGETCQNRSGTVHVSLARSPAAATSTTITDPVPSGSFLEQREDFVGFLVCHGSLLLPYSKRAAISHNGGIRRNLKRDEAGNVAECGTLAFEAFVCKITPSPK